jgi:hypothetical protein
VLDNGLNGGVAPTYVIEELAPSTVKSIADTGS